MLWLGLFFPELPLDVVQRRAADPQTAAMLAVCDRLTVLRASAAARALGVLPGIRRATALALAPELTLVDRNLLHERQALHQLAICVLQFTPSVTVLEPGVDDSSTHPGESGLLLEVEASLRLFEGIDGLLERLRRVIDQQGFAAAISRAPTPAAAWLLARQPAIPRTVSTSPPESSPLPAEHQAITLAEVAQRLAPLPVSLLVGARPHLTTLTAIGIRRIGELQRLPRAGLARRFGKPLLQELDQACGRIADPRPVFEAPLRFDTRLELLANVEFAEALLFAARRLVWQLTAWLQALQRATRQVSLSIEHDDHPATVLTLQTADPTRSPERLSLLLREKLAVTELPAPAHTLRLSCLDTQPLATANQELFLTPATQGDGLGSLIERLQVRLGREHVQQLRLIDDHRPEAAYRLESIDNLEALHPTALAASRTPASAASASAPASASTASASTASASAPSASVASHSAAFQSTASQSAASASAPLSAADSLSARYAGKLPRPLWMLDSPLALREQDHRPFWHSPLHLLAGPERIETGWWDGHLVQRDYFIAEDQAHVLYWIFRERLPDPESRQGWFMQGRFG